MEDSEEMRNIEECMCRLLAVGVLAGGRYDQIDGSRKRFLLAKNNTKTRQNGA